MQLLAEDTTTVRGGMFSERYICQVMLPGSGHFQLQKQAAVKCSVTQMASQTIFITNEGRVINEGIISLQCFCLS